MSIHFVRKLLRRRRDPGSIAPKPRGGGNPSDFGPEVSDRVRQAVAANDAATLAERARAAGVACSFRVAHRRLTALGVTRKESRGGRPSRTAPT